RLCWGRPPEGFVEVLYLRTVYQKLPSGFRLNQRRLVSRSGRMAVVRWPAFEDHKPDTLAGALAARKKVLTAYLERDGIDQVMYLTSRPFSNSRRRFAACAFSPVG